MLINVGHLTILLCCIKIFFQGCFSHPFLPVCRYQVRFPLSAAVGYEPSSDLTLHICTPAESTILLQYTSSLIELEFRDKHAATVLVETQQNAANDACF